MLKDRNTGFHSKENRVLFLSFLIRILQDLKSTMTVQTRDQELFWFFGGFRCGVPLFIVMLVVY